MTKISYPVKIPLSSLTCEVIRVVITTSVSANRKLPSQQRAFTFLIHKSVALKNKVELSNQLPNFDVNIFDHDKTK